MKKIDGGDPTSTAMDALAERSTLLFDYVDYYQQTEIQVSVIESTCNAKIDLAFLIDGSDSIDPSDFYLASALSEMWNARILLACFLFFSGKEKGHRC